MAGASVGFAGQVSAWVAQTKQRQRVVFQESTQRIIEIMQTPVGAGGNMPIVTGFLRASLRVYLGPVMSAPTLKVTIGAVRYDVTAIAATIANAQIGDTISALYLANYAMRVNYGFVGKDSLGREFNQNGRLFVDLAAQRWPSVVRQVSQEAKARAGKP